MTDIVVSRELVGPLGDACVALGLRRFNEELGVPLGTNPPTRTLRWTPDLTAQEQATVNTLLKTVTGTTLLSPADYDALATRLANIRTFRQQTRNEFMAKTADQRDRELFDATTDLIAIVLRLLRE